MNTVDTALTGRLDDDAAFIKSLFADVDTLVSHAFQNRHDPDIRFCLVYCDGVVSSRVISEDVLRPLMLSDMGRSSTPDSAVRCLLVENKPESNIEDIISAVCYGDVLLLIDGYNEGILLNCKAFTLRSISEPDSEKVLVGPREGFTEGIMLNLSMLRRRFRTHKLKMRFFSVGRHSKTQICISYVDGIVDMDIVKELYRRLESIDIDAVLDSNYISEVVAEKSFLGFSSVGSTERPDVVAGKLLEGRIAIFVDGTPVVLTVPHLMVENFQSNEDYYTGYQYASFARIMRVIGFFLTISVPAIYVAIEAYSREILPIPMLINIASERAHVPLTSAVECIIMLLAFDILREAGLRMPSQGGQALSVVGALVIGQAAVSAGMVAAPMLIMVAFAGVTGMLTPKLNASIIICRYSLLLLAAAMGLVGVVAGLSALLIHVLSLESMGVPQVMPVGKLGIQDVKDTFIRAPWSMMRTRGRGLTNNVTRQSGKGNGDFDAN